MQSQQLNKNLQHQQDERIFNTSKNNQVLQIAQGTILGVLGASAVLACIFGLFTSTQKIPAIREFTSYPQDDTSFCGSKSEGQLLSTSCEQNEAPDNQNPSLPLTES